MSRKLKCGQNNFYFGVAIIWISLLI